MNEFRMEPVACVRCYGGDTYYLKDMPADRQKLVNKVTSMVDSFSPDRTFFLEVYDTRGNMHLINTRYVIDIYIDERAYLRKEK